MVSKTSYYQLDPKIYDDQFWWKKDDIEFWKETLIPKTNSILEIAAGTGRLAAPLIREGYQYTGLEISNEYCHYANKKLHNIISKHVIIQGDMRSFDFKKKFDKIFIPFNSLLHILNEQDFLSTLDCIKHHMHDQSELFIDIFVPHSDYLQDTGNSPNKRVEFFNSMNKKETIIKESILYDDVKEIITVDWLYENQHEIYKKFSFQMKIYYPDTMNRILTDSGFYIIDLWGDYQKSQFSTESNLQIYKCRK